MKPDVPLPFAIVATFSICFDTSASPLYGCNGVRVLSSLHAPPLAVSLSPQPNLRLPIHVPRGPALAYALLFIVEFVVRLVVVVGLGVVGIVIVGLVMCIVLYLPCPPRSRRRR